MDPGMLDIDYIICSLFLITFFQIQISQVVGRIIYCNEPTMITDVYQFCKTSREKHTANMMLIRYFLDKRDYMTALEILDNNSVEEIMDCSEDLIQNAKLFDEMGLLLRNEPYIEIISCLKSRLRNSKRPGNRTFISLADNLQVCSQIRSRFYTKLKVSDLELPKKRQDLITTLLYSLSRDVSDESISPTEAVDSCKRIATLLNESKELTMIKFCKILSNNLKTFIECANYINHNENDAKSLCLMATLILKSTCPTANQDDTLDTTSYVNEAAQESTANVKDEIKCLKIAQKLTTKAILRARLDELLPCVEVFNWTMANFYMIRNTNAIEKDLFVETYLPEFSEPSTSSLHCLKDIINTYISYCEFTNRIHQLPMMIQHLCLGGQSLTAFKVVLTLKHSLRHFKNIDSSVMQILNTIVKQCTKQLLQKVCSVNRIDTELTYWLLISCGRNESIVFINHQLSIFKREISKFKALAELALRILNNYKITASKKFYMEMIQVSNWWIRIPECQIPMKTFFVSSKEQLLESLIHHHHVDLEMIQAFCKDFNFNVQCYYQIYLKKNLLNWKPEYDKVEAVNGNINIHFKTSESELLERCTEVVKLMEAKESVYLFINNLRHEANYYHYEVFSTIFTLLTKLNKNKDHRRNLLLLQFLKTYRRISKPSDSEMEEWYTLFPDSQTIDPLSNWRMPFTPTLFSSDIWKIIRPELNLQTYKIWFEVIPTLDNILNKNEICSYVIKKIVSSGILQKHTCDPCVLYPIHDHLFELIDKCVQNMTNLEMATSAVYQLVMHTPKGADQVNAAKLCLKYAIQYKESGQENDPALLKAFIKVQKKYQSFAATHILHICQIDVEKYSNILLEPNELIDALYTDESIIERADRVLLNCPDINKAVDQLGILFNIDIHKARLTLLESLLSELSSLTTENDMNSANIKRAAYICRSEDTTDWQKYLLKVGLGESGKSTYYKANALSCFIIISDVLTIEESTETSFDEFR
ncbi:hypothetical protein AMK59_221 [Oryctes borbonicus]|uniref:Uncharacterized protein n=1 Tax=Oryctes borbonicus TaxID=1629725 RepID=A0A0T6B9Q9_9SCAR|nr:hypothetical protein AMK59_221 [Oryctes borbonicus]